jgi:hypothetical protein
MTRANSWAKALLIAAKKRIERKLQKEKRNRTALENLKKTPNF